MTLGRFTAISPFFNTSIDQIVIEASRDGGRTWTPLSLPNTGSPRKPPIGDPRYAIPLNLADAFYQFRARNRRDGATVGQMSRTIGEDGKLIEIDCIMVRRDLTGNTLQLSEAPGAVAPPPTAAPTPGLAARETDHASASAKILFRRHPLFEPNRIG